MVDISRDARWGRVMEGAGEDPYLGSLIAKARVEGFQGGNDWRSLADVNTVLACCKHFAAYGAAEAGRDYNTFRVVAKYIDELLYAALFSGKGSGSRYVHGLLQ